MALRQSMTERVRQAVNAQAGIVMSLYWRGESKQWELVGSFHTPNRTIVRTVRIDHTGAPDQDDFNSLMRAIRSECESWLW